MRLKRIIDELSEAVFPSNIYCTVCGSMIDRSRPYALCDTCIRKMHWINGEGGTGTCAKCGKALPPTFKGKNCYDCMSRKHYFEKGFSCMTYGMHERELMMDIKYHEKGYMALKMGDIMYDRMAGELNLLGSRELFCVYSNEFFCGNEDGIIVDLILPVPVSKGRLTKRGYNQSALMAKQFRRRWADEINIINDLSNGVVRAPICDENILIRAQETEMLRSLNPAERTLVLKEAFAVRKETAYRLKGKTVLLVDDIYTTGATSDACSRVLLEGGAGKVYVLTLCSGGNRKP